MRDLDLSSGFVTNRESELRKVTKAFWAFYFLICQVQPWADQKGPFQLKGKKKKKNKNKKHKNKNERTNERKKVNILNKQKKMP